AGLFDFFDGSLARASGQVTPFGAFLDSVIDRYSDLVVLLGIVVLFARTPNARGAILAMAALVGSVMVSYTKARAESIGIECNVGMMERPERLSASSPARSWISWSRRCGCSRSWPTSRRSSALRSPAGPCAI